MRKAIRTVTAFLAAAAALILMAAAYYYYSLPDRFYVIAKDSFLPAFADRYLCAAISPATAESSPLMAKARISLLSSIPIKNVTAEKTERRYVICGGEPFGVRLLSEGVMVVKLEGENCPAAVSGIECGDSIISVNGINVLSNSEISLAVRNSGGRTIPVVIKRDGKEMTVKLTPEVCEGSYRAGMWVRDSSAGIGTLTFYDPETGVFGGLGHPVCDSDTGKTVEIREGTAESATIHGYESSKQGSPGALLGSFSGEGSIGRILANDSRGIFGVLGAAPSHKEELPIAFRQEVKKGDAVIYTTIDGSIPKSYKVKIEEIDMDATDFKNLVIRVTDHELLEKTGGILQGMSGSPIIQDGKLVGAVTHVFVNSPDMGYGIFAEEMYDFSSKVFKEEKLAS